MNKQQHLAKAAEYISKDPEKPSKKNKDFHYEVAFFPTAMPMTLPKGWEPFAYYLGSVIAKRKIEND